MCKREIKILRQIKKGEYAPIVSDVQILKKLESDGLVMPPLSKMGEYRLTDIGLDKISYTRKIAKWIIETIKIIKA